MKRVLLALISLYRFAVSPLSGPKCRFYPTCSAYAREALQRHGTVKGSLLGARRLLKCHPWHKGPWTDPVPERVPGFTLGGFFGYKRRRDT